MKAVMRARPGSAVQSCGPAAPGRTTRLRLSAAARSRSATTAGSPTPARSMALTSMWAASTGASSAARPVSRLTTPPGRSDVANTSVRVTAGSGAASLAITTTVFPGTSTGATTDTRPSNDDACGANTATTPTGSGSEKSKYGPATGLDEPHT